MAFIYDIPHPKKGQLTLLCNNSIVANSKSKTYLVNRMKVWQDELCDASVLQDSRYEIVDMFQNNLVIASYFYRAGEKAHGRPREPQGAQINFVAIDPIRPIRYSVCYAIADDNDNIITDLDLLGRLYDFRFVNNFPCEITNKTLAYMATYLPLSEETFVKGYGLGEKKYQKCGKEFIACINRYLDEKTNK